MTSDQAIKSAIGLLTRALDTEEPKPRRALIKLAIGDADKAYYHAEDASLEKPHAIPAKTTAAGRWTGNR